MLTVLFVAAVARATHLVFIIPDLLSDSLMGDARSYDVWGLRIAHGDWLGDQVFYQDPFYPYFLGVVYRIFGHEYIPVLLAQAALGCCTVLMIYRAAQIIFDERAALWAGLLAGLSSSALFYESQILKETFVAFFMSLLLVVIAARSRPGRQDRFGFGSIAATGVLLGLLCLNRGNAFFFLPIFVVSLVWQERRRLGRASQKAAVLVVSFGLILLPSTLRNWWVSGEWVMTTAQAGPNLYIGNNPQAIGTYVPLISGREMPTYERSDAKALAEKKEGREMSATEIDRFWKREAFAFIRENPSRFAELFFTKIWLFLTAEAGDTIDIQYQRDLSPVLRFNPIRFGSIMPLALAGIPFLWFGRRACRLSIVLLATTMVSVGLFFFFSRYRYLADPILIILAAGFLTDLLPRSTRPTQADKRKWQCLLLRIVMLIFTCGMVHAPLMGNTAESRGVAYVNRGHRYYWAQEFPKAIESYQRALEINPRLQEAQIFLGGALEKCGRYQDACGVLLEAKAIAALSSEAWYTLAFCLDRAGRTGEAERETRALLAREPTNEKARQLLRTLARSR